MLCSRALRSRLRCLTLLVSLLLMQRPRTTSSIQRQLDRFHTVASRPLKVSDIVPAHPTTDVTKIPALSLSLSVMCKSVYLRCFIDDNDLRFASCNLCSRFARSTRTGHLLSSTPPTRRLFRRFRGPAQAAGDHRNGSDIAIGMRIPYLSRFFVR